MRRAPIVLLLLVLATAVPSSAAAEPAAAFPEAQSWDLTTIYPSDVAWRAARDALVERIDAIPADKGRLGESAEVLLRVMEAVSGASQDLARLSSYATFRSDLDTRDGAAMALRQEAGLLATRLSEAAAWIDPELLGLEEERVERFLAAEPRLAPYRMPIRDVLRRREHTLGDAEERILAAAGLLGSTPWNNYTVLANADLPFPEFTPAGGETLRLNQAAYTRLRGGPDRAERERVFHAFFGTYKSFERTFGSNLYGQVKRDVFFSRSRGYGSSLEAALDDNAVPVEVYRTLVRETGENLGTLHRYLRLRQRLLGLEDLAYHDLYAPIVAGVEGRFPIGASQSIVHEAMAPLGEDYRDRLRRAFHGGWIDAPPRPGKRQGAYANGSIIDLHPFVLLNHNDDYESLSVLAHEMGHALHSDLANEAQPWPTANYSIFVAEVASTFNEVLLNRFMLDRAPRDEERLAILGAWLENLRVTYFRQAMFAEFELAIHEAVEAGESLTGERLTEIYGGLLRRYYGHDEGVCRIDPLYEVEWAYIPHFYYNFYVFQYATGIAASSALALALIEEEPGALERYLEFLRAGGSDYPVGLLQRAGVDLTRPEPYRAAMALMNDLMDRIEAILDRRG